MAVFTNCTVDCKCGKVQMIEYLYNSIVSCLVDSACNSVTKTRCNYFQFWWDENLKDLKCKSIGAHALWKANGCPTSGDIYNLKRCISMPLIISMPLGRKIKMNRYLFLMT